MKTLDRGPSLTDLAMQEIRSRIVRGVFRFGEALSEITLANALGVSKTPVREALVALKREGLVEVHPQRGSFVFAMDAQQVRELSELREVLEPAALAMALARNGGALSADWAHIVAGMRDALDTGDSELYRTLDGSFHRLLFERAGNAFLLEAFESIAFRVQALRNRLSLAPSLNATSFEEHAELARLAAAGDGDAATALMRRHIVATREHYLAVIETQETIAEELPPKGRRRAARR